MVFNCVLALIVVCLLLIVLYRKHQTKSHKDTNKNKDKNIPNENNDSDEPSLNGLSQDESTTMWDDPILAARLAEELENKWKIRPQTNSRTEQLSSEGEEPLNREWMQGSSSQHNRMSRKTGVNTAANRDKIDI